MILYAAADTDWDVGSEGNRALHCMGIILERRVAVLICASRFLWSFRKSFFWLVKHLVAFNISEFFFLYIIIETIAAMRPICFTVMNESKIILF